MIDVYCVLQFEDENGVEFGQEFLLPYSPFFTIGQEIHLAESIDRSFVNTQDWNTNIELHKDFLIIKISQSFEHRYMKKMSTHHFITLTLKEIK